MSYSKESVNLKAEDPLCEHYIRRCYLICPVCDKRAACRFCHDTDSDNITHQLDRHAVTEVVCSNCDERQKKSAKCVKCETDFGKYTCLICNMFDDKEKGQFHCNACGLCRIGGHENFFHCDTCGICLNMPLKDSHQCIENLSHDNCPICLQDMHSSVTGISIIKCGHMIHSECFQGCCKKGIHRCPKCLKSMVDMEATWMEMDRAVRETQMPAEYNVMKTILCYDCGQRSLAKYHLVGMKCASCGSYNTTETSEEAQQEGAQETAPPQQAENQDGN